MKNTKTIAATIASLLVILVGASLWVRNSQEVRVGTEQPTTNLSGAVPTPTLFSENSVSRGIQLDTRAVEWDSKGVSLMTESKFLAAADAFQKSLAIQEAPTVRYALGRALAQAGRKGEAMQAFQQVAQSQDAAMSAKAKKAIDKLKRG